MQLYQIKTKFQDGKSHTPQHTHKPCAVHCWHPIESDPIPTMLKVQDSDGEIITIKQITTHSCTYIIDLFTKIIEYKCTIITPSKVTKEIYLYYYHESLQWKFAPIVPI